MGPTLRRCAAVRWGSAGGAATARAALVAAPRLDERERLWGTTVMMERWLGTAGGRAGRRRASDGTTARAYSLVVCLLCLS